MVTNAKYVKLESTRALAIANYVILSVFVFVLVVLAFFSSYDDPDDSKSAVIFGSLESIIVLLVIIMCGFRIALDRIAYW